MERYVRKATAKDLPVVLDLIESGRRIMRENGNTHPFPALTRPYFITFLLRPNAALYYQIFSRRAAELIEPRR